MKKILLTFILGSLFTVFGYSQGDCFSTATQISSCGYVYAGNNDGFGDCAGDLCSCVGGGSNPSNLDDDCSTACSACQTPCGSDFLGSVENSMFWYFRPTESCDFQLCVTADNCCCAQGGGPDFMQVWIGQRDTTTGLITQYHVNDNSNTSITGGNQICYTFNVDQSDGDLVIMVDGNAGSECDIWLDLGQVNCTDTCPVVTNPQMSVNWLSFKAKVRDGKNVVSWGVVQKNTLVYNVQRSLDGTKFDNIASVTPKEDGTTNYNYTDTEPEVGRNYYRIQEVDENGSKSYSKVIHTVNVFDDLYGDVIKRYDLMGNEVNGDYKGVVIEHYSSGRYRKIVK